jgi:hypothetical protein
VSLQQQYADIYGVQLKEVKQWCSDFASGNVPDSVKEWMEPTKEERINSIKSYIQRMVDQSVTGQVKADLIAGRIASSEVKVIAECPF